MMSEYKDWIVRFYASHKDIPKGHSDCETLKELVRCKDCKHRPKQIGEGTQGFNLEFPDWECPCQCDDPWYNWMPEDDWYCGNGERKEK